MISAAQIKAGRALLNIKQSDLAKVAGVSLATLNNIERGIGDPRTSTLDAIERALFQAGVETESDGVTESVRLHRLARPSAYETFHASQRILEALSRDSLLQVSQILFFSRRDHAVRDGPDAVKLCLLLEGAARTVLFDQVGFTVASGARVAEVAGILLAAIALHNDRLFHMEGPIEDTTLSAASDAVARLRQAAWMRLEHPRDWVNGFADWNDLSTRYGARKNHPMADLQKLLNANAATQLLDIEFV